MRDDNLAVRGLAGGLIAVLGLGAAGGDVAAQETACGDRATLRVLVLDEANMARVRTATVIVRWTGTRALRSHVRQDVDAAGSLVVCAPPDAREATVWAEFGDLSSEEATVSIVGGTIHDITLGIPEDRGKTGRLIGRVYDAMTDDAVAAAAVAVPSRLRTSQTDRRGLFVLSGVPVGAQELTVRHLGYAPLTYAVEVSSGHTTEIEIGMVPDPIEMAPIVATATRSRRLELKGFYERRERGEFAGTGTFYTAEDVDRRRPLEISHMVADESGLRLECRLRRTDCRLVNTRLSSTTMDACPLSFYVDGMPSRGTALDDFVRPGEVAGMEIYMGLASGPAEFPSSRCGLVVVWTK